MTLAVSTFYSDRIKCSVDIVGMSKPCTFLEHTEALPAGSSPRGVRR